MHNYTKKIIPAREEEVFSEMTCDMCGQKSNRKDWCADKDRPSIFERIETTIEIRKVQKYPESYSYEATNYHLCPNCFPKLEKWLQDQGANPTYSEYD